jgi:hypothetical protein
LETVAALIANRFDKVPLLLTSRDEYVLTARAAVQANRVGGERDLKIFLSYNRRDSKVAAEVKKALEVAGFQTFFDMYDLPRTASWQSEIEKELPEADAMIAIISNNLGEFQKLETEAFLRSSLRSEVRRPIIPLSLPGSEKALGSSHLSDFRVIAVDPNKNISSQVIPLIGRLNNLVKGRSERGNL